MSGSTSATKAPRWRRILQAMQPPPVESDTRTYNTVAVPSPPPPGLRRRRPSEPASAKDDPSSKGTPDTATASTEDSQSPSADDLTELRAIATELGQQVAELTRQVDALKKIVQGAPAQSPADEPAGFISTTMSKEHDLASTDTSNNAAAKADDSNTSGNDEGDSDPQGTADDKKTTGKPAKASLVDKIRNGIRKGLRNL